MYCHIIISGEMVQRNREMLIKRETQKKRHRERERENERENPEFAVKPFKTENNPIKGWSSPRPIHSHFFCRLKCPVC